MSARAFTGPEENASVHEALVPPVPPPCFDATATTILSTTHELIEANERLYSMIVQTVDPAAATFDNTILPVIHEENRLLCERQLTEFFASVSPFEGVRQAARTAKRQFAEFDARTSTRQDLYDLIFVVSSRAEGMDPESRRLIDRLLSDFSRQGLAATPEHRRRLHEIDAELNEVETEYLHNLQLPEHFDIRVAERELEGVPQRFRHAPRDEDDSNDGSVGLKLGGRMQLLDLLSYVRSHKARETIYREYASHHQPNVALFERAIMLRYEKARILGHTTYTEWLMATRMEKDPKCVVTFLKDLLTTIGPAKDSIVEQWRQMKKEDLETIGQPDDGNFYVWDRFYYTKRMMESAFAFNSDTVKEYFPLEHTVICMLGIFGHLFGLRFVNTDGIAHPCPQTDSEERATVWHEDVLLFAVWDHAGRDQEDADFLGYLYMDLYPRPGQIPGFADLPIHPGFIREDGTRSFPSTGLVCNFDKPSQNEPCLLPHGHVVLLFHELGHGIHDLVAKTRYARFHGASTASDFNEAPSQMLENWCWLSNILQTISKHYKSLHPEHRRIQQLDWDEVIAEGIDPINSLPSNLIEQLVKSKQTRNLLQCLALLSMGLFDESIDRIALRGEAASVDTTLLYHETMTTVYGFDIPNNPPPAQAMDASHFTTDGICIYLTSQLYSSDMFHAAFSGDPMNRTQGLHYRRMVLEKGSREDEMGFLQAFLGRRPNIQALQAELEKGWEHLRKGVV